MPWPHCVPEVATAHRKPMINWTAHLFIMLQPCVVMRSRFTCPPQLHAPGLCSHVFLVNRHSVLRLYKFLRSSGMSVLELRHKEYRKPSLECSSSRTKVMYSWHCQHWPWLLRWTPLELLLFVKQKNRAFRFAAHTNARENKSQEVALNAPVSAGYAGRRSCWWNCILK